MIGQLEPADHKELGPVLIASFMNSTPEPFAIVYTTQGLVKKVKISELSVLWHYNTENGSWEADFPVEVEKASG